MLSFHMQVGALQTALGVAQQDTALKVPMHKHTNTGHSPMHALLSTQVGALQTALGVAQQDVAHAVSQRDNEASQAAAAYSALADDMALMDRALRDARAEVHRAGEKQVAEAEAAAAAYGRVVEEVEGWKAEAERVAGERQELEAQVRLWGCWGGEDVWVELA